MLLSEAGKLSLPLQGGLQKTEAFSVYSTAFCLLTENIVIGPGISSLDHIIGMTKLCLKDATIDAVLRGWSMVLRM